MEHLSSELAHLSSLELTPSSRVLTVILKFFPHICLYLPGVTPVSLPRSTSLLTAALMLCGVGQYKVATLTRYRHTH